MRRAPAAVRGLAPHRLALTAVMVTALLTTTLLSALVSFTSVVTGFAVRASLIGNPSADILVTAPVNSAAAAIKGAAGVRGALERVLPGTPAIFSSLRSDYLDIRSAPGSAKMQTHVISLQGAPGYATLAAGTWPDGRASGAATPVAVPLSLAKRLHVAPGRTFVLRDAATGARVLVTVTGIFRPADGRAPYWSLDPGAASGPQHVGGFAVYPSLVTTRAAMASGRIAVIAAAWWATPDVNRIGAGNLGPIANSLLPTLGRLAKAHGLQNVTVDTSLPRLAGGLQRAVVVARSELAIGMLMLLVVAGATLALATTLLSRQRETEATLLRSRGASPSQLGRTGVGEAALLVAPAAVGGPLLGALLLPALASRGPLARSGLRLPVTVPAVSWLAAMIVAAGCAVIIAQTWLRAAHSPARARAARGRQSTVAAATRSGADIALVVLAVLAGWQVGHYEAPVSTGLNGSIGLDPVLVSAPVLALAAGSVLMLRLLPLAARAGDWAVSHSRGLAAAVAAWQISRRPLRQAGPVLLAVLAVATSVIALAQWSSWRRSVQDQASFATGSDVRVVLPPAAPLPLGRVASLTRAPGVRGSTPVIRVSMSVPNGRNATLLALDSVAAEHVAAIRPDLAGGSPQAMLSSLRPPAPPGVAVPGRPARLLITAMLGRAPLTQPVLSIELTDAQGTPYQVQAGVLPADGLAHALAVTVAPAHQADYPLRVTGFGLSYQMPLRPTHATVLAVDSIRLAARMTGRFGPALPVARSGDAMAARVGSGGSGSGVTSTPAVAGVSAHGGHVVAVLKPGAGNTAVIFGGPPGTVPALISVMAAGAGQPLPAVATSAFLTAAGEHVGATLPAAVGSSTIRLRIVRAVSGFPTVTGPNGGLVVDQAALQEALAGQGALPQPVTEWWLRSSGFPVPPGLPPGTVIARRTALSRGLLTNPLAAAPQLAMLAIAAAAVILAAAGFLVSAATASERTRDIALLTALGTTRCQITRLLCLEQAALAIPAALAGLLLGTLLARLIIPEVTLTATGAHPLPPVVALIPLALPAAVAVLISGVPVLIAALSGGGRIRVTAHTRMEGQ